MNDMVMVVVVVVYIRFAGSVASPHVDDHPYCADATITVQGYGQLSGLFVSRRRYTERQYFKSKYAPAPGVALIFNPETCSSFIQYDIVFSHDPIQH